MANNKEKISPEDMREAQRKDTRQKDIEDWKRRQALRDELERMTFSELAGTYSGLILTLRHMGTSGTDIRELVATLCEVCNEIEHRARSLFQKSVPTFLYPMT